MYLHEKQLDAYQGSWALPYIPFCVPLSIECQIMRCSYEFLEDIKIKLGRQEIMITTKVFDILGVYIHKRHGHAVEFDSEP